MPNCSMGSDPWFGASLAGYGSGIEVEFVTEGAL